MITEKHARVQYCQDMSSAASISFLKQFNHQGWLLLCKAQAGLKFTL